MKKFLIIIGIVIISALVIFWLYQKTNYIEIENRFPKKVGLAEPTFDFKERITKKPFGIYVSPDDSPVMPERFKGYHTGIDIEYEDISGEVIVFAIEKGVVKLSRTAAGYGGVVILETELNGSKHSVVYGHLAPRTLPKIDQTIEKGQQIGVLGQNHSAETGGERKHLHLAILNDTRLDLKGYVESKDELSGWIDPLSYY